MQTLLFFSRLGIYLLLITTPLWLKPAVAVAYDSVSALAWFFLVPLQMGLAYFLHPLRLKSKNIYLGPLLALSSTFFLILLFSGLERDAVLFYIGLALLAFVSTRMIFFSKRTSLLAVLEIFFFAFVYFAFLGFTRSAPEISQQHPALPKALLFLMLLSFLFHSAVVYLASFPDRSFQKKRNELLALACVCLPTFLLLAFFSPRDFVDHEIAFNEWNEEPPPPPRSLGESEEGQGKEEKESKEDEHRNGLPLGKRDEKYPTELQGGGLKQKEVPEKETRPEEKKQRSKNKDKQKNKQDSKKNKKGKKQKERQGGSSQSEGSSSKPNPGKGAQGPRLEGVPADQWNNYRNSQGGGSSNKQNAVMIVASQINPVYAAQDYLGNFSEEESLVPSSLEFEPLNRLAGEHLIESWQDRISSSDDKRKIQPMFFLSTIKQRVLPYRPHRIQPTVQNVIYHPFDLSYHVQSRVSVSQPEDWFLVRDLNSSEKRKMRHYLELKLRPKSKASLERHLKKARKLYAKVKEKNRRTGAERYFERIDMILRGFAKHRYELGFDEQMNLDKINNFLIKDKKGDCTEFSHASAILGRMLGVPSRVVIGYIGSRDLQTPAHRGAVYNLRKRIKLLQEYPLKDLYLITSSHYHAWTQFWLPGFGWIDFETTSFAIPPKPNMDPNNMDVVIPLIEEERVLAKPSFVFPWPLLLRVIAYIAASFALGLYGYRYGRQIYYWLNAKAETPNETKALQRRLLFKLANSAYPLKSHYQTTLEYSLKYSEKLPFVSSFAQVYTTLRFKEKYEAGEKQEKLKELRSSFKQCIQAINSQRPKGFLALLRRIFSLRSLYY